MARKLWIGLVAVAFTGAALAAQTFPAGYIDPLPVLAAARQAIGADNLKCVTIVGNRLCRDGRPAAPERQERRLAARRAAGELHADHELGSQDDEGGVRSQAGAQSRRRGNTAWAGWAERRFSGTRIRSSWSTAATRWHHGRSRRRRRLPSPPEDAERWQLELWLNPHGFLKAAMMPGANPKADLAVGAGRDGPRRSDDDTREE